MNSLTDMALRGLEPFVARAHIEMSRSGQRHVRHSGTLVFCDISGFTALNEKLSRRGREGAELMVDVLDLVFGSLLDTAEAAGGDLLEFGGDALLIRFVGKDHLRRAAAAALAMQSAFAHAQPAVQRIQPARLGISMGLETGPLVLLSLGLDHRQLAVAGATVDAALDAESAASAGEVVLGPAAAAALDDTVDPGDGWMRLACGRGDFLAPMSSRDRAAPADQVDLAALLSRQLVEALAEGVPLGEHRRVAPVFVRFKIADGAWRDCNDAALFDALNPLACEVEAAADAHGVTTVNIDTAPGGGKFVLVAGAPATHGNNVDRAITTAIAVMTARGRERDRVELSVGINDGVVFCGSVGSATMRAYAVIGDTVNTAARIMAAAPPGAVLCEQAAFAAARHKFTSDPVDPFAAKGKSQPIRAVRVGLAGPRPEAVSADRAPLVGRDKELSQVLKALSAARGGAGPTIEVVGEAGIGKSRLVDQLVATFDAPRSIVLRGGWYAQGSSFRALTDALRPLLPTPDRAGLERLVAEVAPTLQPWLPLLGLAFDVTVPMTPEVDGIDVRFRAERLARAVTELIDRTRRRPLLVVVEDAHWIDAATASVLDHLSAARLPGVAILTTRRPGADGWIAPEPDLPIQLGPLDQDAVALLISHGAASDINPHRLAELVERAEGHPLFLTALVEAARDEGDLPQSIEDALRLELDRVAASTRRTLGLAAVLGATVDLDLLEATTDSTREKLLADLRRAEGVVEVDGGSVRFTHSLRRTVAYEALPYRTRREAHGRAAMVLESEGDPQSELLSLHHSVAGHHAAAWEWSRAAAERARASFSPLSEIVFLERAIDAARHLRSVDDAPVFETLERWGDNLEILGRYDDAEKVYRRAARKTAGSGERARIMAKVGRQCAQSGDIQRGLRWCLRAERAAGGGSDRDQIYPVQTHAALVFRTGDLVESLRLYQRAANLARRAGDSRQRAEAIRQVGTIRELLGRSGVGDLSRAIATLERVGERHRAASALVNLGASYYDRGDWDRALAAYGRGSGMAEPIGDLVLAATAHNNVAEIRSDRGHLDLARDGFVGALATWRSCRYPIGVGVALGNLGRLERRAARLSAASDHLAEAEVAFQQIGADDFVQEVRLRQAELALALGEPERALERLDSTSVDDRSAAPMIATSHRLRALCALHLDDESCFLSEASRARTVARANRLRYELVLTDEVVMLAGVRSSVLRPGQVGARLERLGIVDSGQRALLPSRSVSYPIKELTVRLAQWDRSSVNDAVPIDSSANPGVRGLDDGGRS